MTQEQHPDALSDFQALKSITRGSRQYADDMAMEAMWQALEREDSKDKAGEVFIKAYQKSLKDGK